MQAPTNAHSNWLSKYGITPREAQILDLILQGIDSNQEIADKLGITVSTAKFYMHTIYIRTNINSKLALAMKYMRETAST
jgi:DNA-binding CsgD family transcriptional regulator